MRPVLLDLTRLSSRAGRTLTGVDRVELAYAEGLGVSGVPLHGLVRTALGFVLLDGAGVAAFARAVRSGAWPEPDLLGRLNPRLDGARARGQALARALAVARAPRGRLPRLLRALPRGTATLLVGHADLDDRVLGAARTLSGPVAALVHDAIPLDWPDLQRPGTPEAFRARLAAVARHADLVLAPSEAAAGDVRRHLAGLAAPDRPGPPPVHAVPLGVEPAAPDPSLLPPGLPQGAPLAPFVMTLGTIEPRKNHALLLDLWEGWPEAPPLLVVGSRGWGNAEVFRRLDARPRNVIELAGLPDGAVAALLRDASALLMPSLAEGFGLPAVEAAAWGTPVLCGDLAIFRETLEGRAIVCGLGDRYAWRAALEALLRDPPPRRPPGMPWTPWAPPGWDAHLKRVLTLLG